MARILGPEKLGYFTYLQWLTNISGQLAMAGLPVTTRKYIAEFLGVGEPGIVWQVFIRSLRLQLYLAVFLAVCGSILMYKFVEPPYLGIGLVLLASLVPKLIACILSAANFAAENVKANTAAAVISNIVSILLVNASLLAGWGLWGVAISMLVAVTLEMVCKAIITLRWLHPAPGELPAELHSRMLRFSGQSMVLLILNLVVWDRSDLIFLKWLDKDIRQVTFFSLAFNLVDKILMLPRSFSSAMGLSVMAEYSRDRVRFYRVASSAGKYALLTSVPVMFGLGAVSGPLIRLLYGEQYLPVIPVLMIAALFGSAKPVLSPVQNLLQAEDRQQVLIWCGIFAAGLNIALDVLLIPTGRAQGAMIANGIAQAVAIGAFWGVAARNSPIHLPLGEFAKIIGAGAAMALPIYLLGQTPLSPALQLCIGIPVGALLYLLTIRWSGVLDEQDERRLLHLIARLPKRAHPWADKFVTFLVPTPRPVVSTP
jgi:O-antigen/teichoic acid export membrane protein